MFGRRVLLLLFLSITWFSARADIFVVTSNADSGPGTLREALTLAAANGSTVKDFINFNLPDVSEAGRTISLISELPNVSSNLIIDGTTQPGGKFGQSSASVILRPIQGVNVSFLLNLVSVNNVEIYGISFTGNWLETFNNVNGISISNSNAIRIGNGGLGNVFNDLLYGISVKASIDIIIQNNIAGLKADGLSSYKNYSATLFQNCNNVTIGGLLSTERNIFTDYGQSEIVLQNCKTIVITGNFLGTDYTGNAVTGPSFIGEVYTAYGVVSSNGGDLIIDNNILSGLGNAVQLSQPETGYAITNNRFGVGASNATNLNNRAAISIYNAVAGGVISNNVLGYNQNAVIISKSQPVTISHNSFFCNINNPVKIIDSPVPVPVINILSKTSTQIIGTTTPNATIELFYTDECQLCQGKTYIATVTAGADGNWSYTGTLGGAVLGNATSTQGVTSPFSGPEIISSNASVRNAVCGSDGAITGFKYANATNIKWTDINGMVVGTAIDLIGVPAGEYRIQVDNGTCSSVSDYYEVKDNGFSINVQNAVTVQPSCGQPNGKITGVKIINDSGIALVTEWINNNSGLKVSELLDFESVPAGIYTLHVKSADGCEKTYGPVKIDDETAPAIDQSNALLTDATCDNYDGSIKGLKVSPGSFTYFWTNDNSKVFPVNGPDLDNIPPGTYTLNVKYGECEPVQSTPITISSKNGVSIDFITQSGRSATCNESNGEITGLRAPGATSYVWRTKSGSAVLSDKLDLKGVPAGIYTLTISNATCSKDIDFEIPGFPPTVFTGITYTNKKTCQAFNTGSITVNTDNANEQPLKYRWVNNTGENVGFDKTVQFLPVGTYKLYLTDKNYCENPYPEIYTIGAYPEFKVVTFGTVTNTQCGVGTGGVTATTVTGGTGNYVYQWLDAGNNTIGSQASIDNLAPGAYKLRITDGGCSLAEIPYNITDEAATPPAPFADNVRVYNPGKVTIKVNDPFPTAIYRLYESATSQQPLRDAIGGVFNIDISESRSYYVSLTYGYCESDRTEVQVFVSALKGAIANTFTPNGDGVNDFWVVEGLSTYPDVVVSVFNRYGQAVFQSIGYAKPFDGSQNGKPLPAGVYYYLIDLKNNNRLSGNVTILR